MATVQRLPEPDPPNSENRPTPEPIGSAVLIVEGVRIGPFLVESLTAGGVVLQGPFPAMPLGTRVRVLFDLPKLHRIWIWGTIVSPPAHRDRASVCCVALRHSSPWTEDLIQEAALARLETARLPPLPKVVVVSSAPDLQCKLRDDLRLLRRETVPFATSRDASVWADRAHHGWGAILIDARAAELAELRQIADRFPDKRRVLLGEVKNTLALSEVHGVLDMPWQWQSLEIAVGLSGATRALAKRVLFVDDEALVLASLQLRLRKALRGCEVVWATSGQRALEEFQARPFDVVVSDLKMPGVDGFALLEQVKRDSPEVRRVVLSGYATEEAHRVADHVLHKPCELDRLREIVLAA